MNNSQKATKIVEHIMAEYSPVSFHIDQDGLLVVQSPRSGYDSISVKDETVRIEVISLLRHRLWEIDEGYARTVCA